MIHWQYIKGAYDKTASNQGTKILYTFIDFYGGQDIPADPNLLTQDMLPEIWICDNTDRSAAGAIKKSAGHILTSNAANQSIYQAFTFAAWLTARTIDGNRIWNFENGTKVLLELYDNSLWIGCNSGNPAWTASTRTGYTTVHIAANSDDDNYSATTIHGNCTVTKYLRISNAFSSAPKTTDGDLSAKAIYSEGICESLYFNSTSDRRAKTDIKPINKSVLPLITNTQLYSFKYKDLDTPSIGIIAQDVQDVDFDGFSLVDNKEASGQDMDYMSIHESKLVYILWKAIQEQQKEIEDLKEQIKKGL